MSEREAYKKAIENEDDESGPTEKLRESSKSETEQSVPGAQNPDNPEIKDEENPNTE
jgi:hypothetical protein